MSSADHTAAKLYMELRDNRKRDRSNERRNEAKRALLLHAESVVRQKVVDGKIRVAEGKRCLEILDTILNEYPDLLTNEERAV